MQKRFTPDAGGMFPEWEEVTLGDIAEFSRGKGLTKKDVFKKGKRKCLLYGQLQVRYGTVIKNVTGMTDVELKNPVLSKSGDVLISGTISAGLAKASCIKEDGVIIGGDINILRPKEGIDGEFLARAINANTKKFKRFLEGSVILHLKNENIKEVSIRIPKSIEEQRKIAAALAAYDEMIVVKTTKLETWQECKKRMVKEIFGRTKRFRDDDGNEFPEWEEKTLGEVAEINPASAESLPEVFYYMDLGSIDSGIWIEKRLINKKSAPSRAQRIAQQDDVFFQSVRPLNKDHYHYTKKADKSVVASTGFIQLRMKNESNAFLYQLLYEDNFNKEVKKYMTGSNYPAINTTSLSKIKVMIPCMEEQQKIGSFLAEIDKEIEIQKEFIKTYAEGKNRMIRELVGC